MTEANTDTAAGVVSAWSKRAWTWAAAHPGTIVFRFVEIAALSVAVASLGISAWQSYLAAQSLDEQSITGSYQLLATREAGAFTKLKALEKLNAKDHSITGITVDCMPAVASSLARCTQTGLAIKPIGDANINELADSVLSNLSLVVAWDNLTFEHVTFLRTNFEGTMRWTTFRNSSFRGTKFDRVEFFDPLFDRTDFAFADLSSATMSEHGIASYANISGTSFCRTIYLVERDPSGATERRGCMKGGGAWLLDNSWFSEGIPPSGLDEVFPNANVEWVCPDGFDPDPDAGSAYFESLCRKPTPQDFADGRNYRSAYNAMLRLRAEPSPVGL